MSGAIHLLPLYVFMTCTGTPLPCLFFLQVLPLWRRVSVVSKDLLTLTSALHGGDRLTSRPGRFASWKEVLHALSRKLGGSQSWSGCFEAEKNVVWM
jgi:hypothetical protein